MANYKIKNNRIIADISKLTEEELLAVKNYRALGYELESKTFKKGITKDEMLEELKADKEVLKDFETAYNIKAKEVENNIDIITALKDKYGINIITKSGKNAGKYIAGYHLACQIYTKWKKNTK